MSFAPSNWKTGPAATVADETLWAPTAEGLFAAWAAADAEGALGSILFAEGHYLHPMAVERFWRNSETFYARCLAVTTGNAIARTPCLS